MQSRITYLVLPAILVSLVSSALTAQTFDSGSDGTDGVLNIAASQGAIDFDPKSFTPVLDADGDNVYHFTSITVGSGTTLRFRADILGGEGKPVIFLAQGLVQVNGTINFDGQHGYSGGQPVIDSVAGAGGYDGGRGKTSTSDARSGNGPGGARVNVLAPNGASAASAGHLVAGSNGSFAGFGGEAYGNVYLQPLLGGSGGAGGLLSGAGAGGGAFLLASSNEIRIAGMISARGGSGGFSGIFNTSGWNAGGGSGGVIRLMAPTISGGGTLNATGGTFASAGRIRIEAYRYLGFSSVLPGPSIASPGLVFPPATAPLIKVTTIDGVAVVSDPTGSFAVPDVTVLNGNPVTIALTVTNIPVNTILKLTVRPETGAPIAVDSTALTGTLSSSTATATVTFPSGFSRIFIKASW